MSLVATINGDARWPENHGWWGKQLLDALKKVKDGAPCKAYRELGGSE